MERDNLIQIVTLIIAVVAIILAVFAVVVPEDEETEEDENEAPNASIAVAGTSVEAKTNVLFDGSGSTDSDGTIVEYSWDFGDGGKDSGMYTNHAFNSANTYTVTLKVVDNDGETDVATVSINVTEQVVPQNNPPVASLLLSASTAKTYTHFNCDGSSSTDSDGVIVMYLWDFGDGINSTGIYTNHYYSSPGTYTITLTVTDDDGAKNSSSGSIIVTEQTGPPLNDPPTALFSAEPLIIVEDEKVRFNASESSDSDGVIVEYMWSFGDGGMDSGMYSEHTFTESGEHNVTLTVYDNDGASDTYYEIITVEPGPPTGVLDFSKTAPGNYTGGIISLSKELKIVDAYLYIWDASSGEVATQNPIVSGTPFQVVSGIKLTFNDSNSNQKIDGGDVWDIENGEDGDVIRLMFKTGAIIAEYTIMETTPTGALSFTESSIIPGNYTGCFITISDLVFILEVSMNITDDSLGLSAEQEPINSGVMLQVPGGVNITYMDINMNTRIDAGDVIKISGGEAGDQIRFVYIPTGGTIAMYTLP